MNTSFRLFALLALAVPAAGSGQTAYQPFVVSDADALAEQVRRLGANPLDLDALLTAGELSLRLDDVSAAGAFFSRAEKIDSRNARAKAGEGALLVRSERPGEALRLFTQAEAMGLPPTRFAADRGLAYDLLGDQPRAQRDYKLAMSAQPDAETRRRYALSLGIAGKQAQALDQLAPLIRQNDRAAWRSRAFILAMGGDLAEASRIAQTMMPPGSAAGLQGFFAELPRLPAVDRAFAVHFGEVHPTAARMADARLAPVLAPLPLEVVPVQVALVAKSADDKHRRGKKDKHQVEVAAATPVAALSPPLPLQAPAYQAPAYQAPGYAAPTYRPAYPPRGDTRLASGLAARSPAYDRPLSAAEQASLVAAGARTRSAPGVMTPYAAPSPGFSATAAGPRPLTPAEQASLAAATLKPRERGRRRDRGASEAALASGALPVPGFGATALQQPVSQQQPQQRVPGPALALQAPAQIAARPTPPAAPGLGAPTAAAARPPQLGTALPPSVAGPPVVALAAPVTAPPLNGAVTRPTMPSAAPIAALSATGTPASSLSVGRVAIPTAPATLTPATTPPSIAGSAPAASVPAIAVPALAAPALTTTPPAAATAPPPAGTSAPPLTGVAAASGRASDPAPLAATSASTPALVPAVTAAPIAEAAVSAGAFPLTANGAAAPAPLPSGLGNVLAAPVVAAATPVPAAATVLATELSPLPASAVAPAPTPGLATAGEASSAVAPSAPKPASAAPRLAPPLAPATTPAPVALAASRTARPARLGHGQADSILAKIVANLSVPAAELGVEGPAAPGAKPQTAAERRRAARAERKQLAEAEPVAEPQSAKAAPVGKRAGKKGVEQQAATDEPPLDQKARDKKALADKEASEGKKGGEPERIWVQVAGGADEGALAKAWAATQKKAPDALAGRQGWTTPLRATNRVLTGPFKTDAEARAYVNQLAKRGVAAFTFTSEAGQKVTRLKSR